MPVIQITSCDLLREERNNLLAVVTEELTRDPRRDYLLRLIHKRLKEVSKEMNDANCPKNPDEGQYMDLIRELEEGSL